MYVHTAYICTYSLYCLYMYVHTAYICTYSLYSLYNYVYTAYDVLASCTHNAFATTKKTVVLDMVQMMKIAINILTHPYNLYKIIGSLVQMIV